ncbi:hypothetical protein B0T22DRAFT_491095 [Podospora appendiculata]|uniref:Uncharacterized protein n=1 Tax=Podospora appendiculata TaxID=314037 RepID=A0AAE0XBR1_9PEZI|nr:hypothetical protein B0T22DRAFT_491095 [Podospora appendiculata]
MSSTDDSSTTPHKGPDSPWRRQYGGWNEPTFTNSGHSGLRPVKPDIKRPLGQGEDLAELVRNGPFPEPNEHDLDYIFSTERFQARRNMGVKSWQLGSFNSSLPVHTTLQELNEVTNTSNTLSSKIVWTFFDKDCADRYGVPNHSMGLATAFTKDIKTGPRGQFVAIFLSNDMLKTLMHGFRRTHAGITERYIGRFHLAVTMVHQLMHAFWMLRVRDGGHDLHGTNHEPFVNDDYECGEPEEPGRRSYLLGLTMFPEDSMTTIVPHFGISMLKAPSYFQTRVSHLNDLELQTYSVREIRHHGGSTPRPHLHYNFSRILMDFKKRTAAWDAIRPWYKSAYAIWQLTPYAIVDLRTPVEMFYNAAQLRNLKLAIELRNGLERRLITYTNLGKIVLGSLYLYQIFYLLITVTMSWKPQQHGYQHGSTEPRSLKNRWKPSRDSLN